MNKFSKIFRSKKKQENLVEYFLNHNKVPWSKGYNQYKWHLINESINDSNIITNIKDEILPDSFGHRVDERVVEYPWIFSNLNDQKEKILDAGSTFNFSSIVNHHKINNKDLYIFTFSPEKNNFAKDAVSYVYGDLRLLPFKDQWFDTIVSQSTIEHIDMDNSIYGYDIEHHETQNVKSYQYLEAVKEMLRVLKPKGTILLTFPFGKFEHHGFFQQFDKDMIDRIQLIFHKEGQTENTFFKYHNEGWKFSNEEELKTIGAYNPHTGIGKGNDNAAHCRGVACMKFKKF